MISSLGLSLHSLTAASYLLVEKDVVLSSSCFRANRVPEADMLLVFCVELLVMLSLKAFFHSALQGCLPLPSRAL